ncbi:MAG: DUF2207 domain-containing protein, partial [Thermoleophilia bacterium]|nr:DUF2207 domain-containing protein [Thermoleophilia bacterium]
MPSSPINFRTGPRHLIPRGAIPRALAALAVIAVAVGAAVVVSLLARAPDRVSVDTRDYGLPASNVSMHVRPDGSVDVVERITFDFNGVFHGAYRDIPMRAGDQIDQVVVCDPLGGSSVQVDTNLGAGTTTFSPPDVSSLPPDVAEQVLDAYYAAVPEQAKDRDVGSGAGSGSRCPSGTKPYMPGANTALGSSGTPGTFGTVTVTDPTGQAPTTESVERVVWHYSVLGGLREFVVAYRARGWVRSTGNAGDPIVINLVPWGGEWNAALGSLIATLTLPQGASATKQDVDVIAAARGAGRTTSTVVERGAAEESSTSVVVNARDLTSHERVDALVTVGAERSGIMVESLPKSPDSLESLQADARDAEASNDASADRLERIDSHEPWTWALLAALVGVVIAGVCATIAWKRVLREDPWPDDVPRLLGDPPGDLPPALAVSLVEQDREARPTALVATVFDLVRRDAYKTVPAQSKARGARVDIALSKGDREGLELADYEQTAMELVDLIVKDGSVAMGAFRGKLKKSLSLSRKVSGKQSQFEKQVASAVNKSAWIIRARTAWITVPAVIGFLAGALGIAFMAWQDLAWKVGSDPRVLEQVGSYMLSGAAGMWVVLVAFYSSRQIQYRYFPHARREAAQWTAYRDFLEAYGDMGDEQTASIELWERHLVYAIAFGCADDILSAVRPEGIEMDPDAATLGAMQVYTFHTFSSGIAARAPEPSSGGSGGGGGFGGGGGGGGG